MKKYKKKLYFWFKFLPERIKYYGFFNALTCPLSHSKVWRRKQVIKLFLKTKKVCQKCGSKYNLTIDHIVPRGKNGGNNIKNLELLCYKCNFLKDNKPKRFVWIKNCCIQSTWESPYI